MKIDQLPHELNISAHALFDYLPDGLLLLDDTFHIVFVNPKAQEYLALLAVITDGLLESLAGHPIQSLTPMITQGKMSHEFTVSPDRIFQVIFQLLESTEIQAHCLLIIRDITERKQIETEMENRVEERTEELDRAKRRLEAILNNSSDAIILAYADGRIRQTNLAFNTLFGYQPDEMFGRSLRVLFDADQQDMVSAVIDQVMRTRKAQRIELVAQRNDETFVADVALAPIPDPISGYFNLLCSLRDITERKQVEIELRKALDKERELSELKNRFISMTSHEFRTPLTTILSSAGLLELGNERMSPEQRLKHMRKIQLAAKNMANLLDDFLYLGSAEAGKLKFKPQMLDVLTLCQDVLEELQMSLKIDDQIKFSFQTDSSHAPVDEKLMRHIVTNLLSNAVKYSPSTTPIYFDVTLHGDELMLRVEDHGIGIPAKDQERLFEAFHRGDNVGTAPGTGLGLVIAKNAVETHGGKIEFTSQIGLGTTFLVTIPISKTLID